VGKMHLRSEWRNIWTGSKNYWTI